MTPAIACASKAKIVYLVHRYRHERSDKGFGEEAAARLGVDAGRVFKTLVIELDGGELAVALVPVSARLSLRSCAAALGARGAKMANPKMVQRATGYVLGGISPLGQKRRLRTVIDQRALTHNTLYVSAGRRGVELELAPGDLAALAAAEFAKIAQ